MNEEEKKESPPSTDNSEQLEKELDAASTDEPNLSAEIIPETEQPQIEQSETPIATGTPNYKPQTEEMEVHHHAHTARKKWTHYLWEFLMLFLAVFCGFMAENFREHQIEHKREKQYIVSLIKDVELDTASLRLTYDVRKKYINYFDSLVFLLRQKDKSKSNDIYFYARFLGRINEFKYHDRTIQQLKSSGSLRLIRNKKAADSITIYDNEAVKLVLNQQDIERNLRNDILYNSLGKVFNGYIWNDMADTTNKATISRITSNPSLMTSDEKLINEFVIKVVYLKTAYRLTNGNIEGAITAAGNLIVFLKKQYHLK